MAAGFLAVLQRRMSTSAYCRVLGVGFAGNTIGALIFLAICGAAGVPVPGRLRRARSNRWRPESRPTVLHRTASRAVVHMVPAHRNVHVARMGFAFYGPFAFVIGGTQHVIANVGFLGLPMLLAAFHASAPHSGIGWGFGSHDFLTSLCITALGNLIGGTLFVAMPFQVIAWLQHRAN